MDIESAVQQLYDKHGITDRTLLYPIPPFGLNTGQVESLTSYVGRLADAHHLSPLALHRRLLSWVAVGRRDKIGTVYRPGHDGPVISPLNVDSGGRTSAAVAQATGLRGIAQLSVHTFQGAFGPRLVTQQPSFCPRCLAESNHQRLVWNFAGVDACAVHGSRLLKSCPVCAAKSTLDHHCCGRSFADLDPEPADAASIALSQAIDEMISLRHTITWAPDLPRRRMEAIAQHHGISVNRVVSLAECKRTLCSQALKLNLDLRSTTAIAGIFGLSLIEFLRGETGIAPTLRLRKRRLKHVEKVGERRAALIDLTSRMPLTQALARIRMSSKAAWKHFPEVCRQATEATMAAKREREAPKLASFREALANHRDGSESLKRALKRLGIMRVWARAHCPEACAGIAERYRLYRLARNEEKKVEAGSPNRIRRARALSEERIEELRTALLGLTSRMTSSAALAKLGVNQQMAMKYFPEEYQAGIEAWRHRRESQREAIVEALACHNEPSEKLSAVAKRLGISVHHARVCHRDACNRITARYRLYRRALKHGPAA